MADAKPAQLLEQSVPTDQVVLPLREVERAADALGEYLQHASVVGLGGGQLTQFFEQRVAARTILLLFHREERVEQTDGDERSHLRTLLGQSCGLPDEFRAS
jgi:hypothetical protein